MEHTGVDMAEQVVRAIRARELYIMPAEEPMRRAVRERLERMMAALAPKGT